MVQKNFLDSRGLPYEEDDLGPVYGHQWSHFNADYNENCILIILIMGVDQIQRVNRTFKKS